MMCPPASYLFRLVVVFSMLSTAAACAQLRISEFMASNTRTLADENGSYEDWIEIQNISTATVNLFDWALTDSSGNLTKWKFPSTNLPPGGFLVVFASNKDRRTAGAPLHTNFKLDAGGEYLALVDPTGTNIATQFAPQYPPQVPDVSYGFSVVASNVTLVATGATARVLVPSEANGGSTLDYTWTGLAANEPFNAAAWTSGATGVGFGAPGIGLNIQASMLNSNASAFVRVPFALNNPTNFSVLTLNLRYNDGFVAWINGVQIARAFAPTEDLAWNSGATAVHTNTAFESMALGIATNLLRSGTNILAIQGLNASASDGTFVILPELVGTMLAGEVTSGLYLTTPTPGAENIGGSSVPGPGIANVSHTPNVPTDNENLVVTAKVFATANALANVTLYYRVMFDSEVTVTMLDDGAHGDGAAGDGVFGATIPADASTTGQMVRYYIVAQDTSGYSSRLPVYSDPASTAQYLGTVVNPDYVTSAIPIVHLFAPASILQPGPTTSWIGADSDNGGYVSVFHDGEFYDNVRMWLRGNSTAGYNKKSHRITFNKEHPFKHDGPGGRIRKTSFVADYPDPTYMRQGLSYWLCNETGADGPFYRPVRLQLNGTFYQLANHNDVHGEELLERLGYDPNGALYNAAGMVVPGRNSTGGFEMKTRVWDKIDAYAGADYYAFTAAIAESNPTGTRMTNVFDNIDIPEVISYMVAARFTHENDDVWANMSLYHDNDGDNLWRIIPFDVNLSWGAAFMNSMDYSGIQVTNDNIKSFPLYGSSKALPNGSGDWNRMYDVIFTVPQTREMFLRRMRTVLDEYVKPPGTLAEQVPIYQKVMAWQSLIAPEAALDRAWWGWPDKSGQCNFDPGINLSNGVASLLNDFLELRRRHFYGKHCVTNTALTIGINKANNAGIPLSQPTNAVIAINGWDYNPVSGNQEEEYVRMTNANAFAVDISGWELDGGIHFKFRPGTVMPAGGVLYVSPNTRTFRARTVEPHGGHGLFVVGPCNGHLNAWGETLTLTDAAGRLVSSNSFVGSPSPAQRYLRVTEIMYNPSPFTSVTNDEQQFEYVELRNISTNVTLNLTDVRFTNGIQFSFTGSAVTSLAPGQTVLVVRNPAAFTARYGSGFAIAGQFQGALDNGGETLRLEDAVGEKILEFAYNDTWYPITDGLGFSLVIVNDNAPWNTWGQKSSWRASGALNGSPGATDPAPPVISPILVNEALTHTDLPQLDSVELFNPGTNTVNIGGWFLTDDFYSPRKYRIPTGTTIGPGSYRVFTENQFNTGPNAFRFSEYGEKVCLFSGNATTNLTGYWHGYEFGEAPNGVSFGRYTNSQTNVFFTLQSAVTLGAKNAYPRVGPIVISEIMYRPPETNGLDNDQDEFIELQNITTTNVPLYYPGAGTNTWRLRNAVDFDFPTNQVLGAGARLLVVGFSPTNTAQLAAFRSKYGVSNSVPVFGPWSGKLDNSSETIELKQPDHPDLVEGVLIIPYIMIDKVSYQDQAPWPKGADGIGNSLQRFSNTGFGNDPTNWFAAGVTAGRATVRNIAPQVSIVAPTDGTTIISSNLTVSVTASDADGSLSLAQLFADGTEIFRWTTGPTNFVWTGASAGRHSLHARAVDALGAISESAEVGVTLIAPPPVITILTPTNGAVLVAGSTVTLGAQATSGGDDATSVSYYVDGNLLGTVAPPFNYSWTAGPAGYHTLSAIAMDEEGETSDTAEVLVFIQALSSNPVLVTESAIWRYLDDGSNQGTNWIAPGFSDDGWASGASKLGYNNGNVGLATVLDYGGNYNNKYITYYFRHSFEVSSLVGMTNLYLEVQRDDGVAIYLNGSDLYRENLPAGTLSYTQFANDGLDNGNTWHAATLPITSLKAGTNVLAAEIHQNQVRSSDIAFNLRLTLMGTVLGPAITGQPQSQTVTNGQPASFTITATGDGPLAYQWRHAGTNLAGCTSNRLTLPAVSDAHAGDFQVVVTNSIGSVTSLVATLTVVVADSDGDGLPDDWELANGTNPNVNDAGLDPDHDGLSNLQEYRAGTSPTNAASALRLESVMTTGDDAVFRFLAVSNRDYTIQMQPAVGDAWQKWLDIGQAPSNRTMVLTNVNNTGTNRFFRLVTPLQP
jgi:hypothetical protein